MPKTEQSVNTEPKPKTYRLDALLDEFDTYADKLDEAKAAKSKIGPVTGFQALDWHLCGALQPGLHVLTGNTGSGKTAFCLQVAAACGFPVLYVTCEMCALELFRRIIARVTETPLQQLKNPAEALPAETMKELARRTVKAVGHLALADATLAFADPTWIRDQAQLIKDADDAEHVLILIDSLHSWAAWLNADEYERLNVALKSLRQLSSELNCPVLYIAEQSKTANRENAKGRDLGTSSPAGFRGIEYGAESVIGLRVDVDKEGKVKADRNGGIPVRVTLLKNRNGVAGVSVTMSFCGALQKFEEA